MLVPDRKKNNNAIANVMANESLMIVYIYERGVQRARDQRLKETACEISLLLATAFRAIHAAFSVRFELIAEIPQLFLFPDTNCLLEYSDDVYEPPG